jgi:hypothetical protein
LYLNCSEACCYTILPFSLLSWKFCDKTVQIDSLFFGFSEVEGLMKEWGRSGKGGGYHLYIFTIFTFILQEERLNASDVLRFSLFHDFGIHQYIFPFSSVFVFCVFLRKKHILTRTSVFSAVWALAIAIASATWYYSTKKCLETRKLSQK